MIQNIIFDLADVLLVYDWETYLDSFEYDAVTREAVADAVFRNIDWQYGDEGKYNEAEWLNAFIENAPAYEREIREVYASLGKCIAKQDYTDAWVRQYRDRGYRIFFLSNYPEGVYQKTKATLSFLETFDGGVFSFREKCTKPNENIYKILLKRYDIKPEEAIFFDDRAENVRAARRLGIHGIVFTPQVLQEELGLKEREPGGNERW